MESPLQKLREREREREEHFAIMKFLKGVICSVQCVNKNQHTHTLKKTLFLTFRFVKFHDAIH